MSKQLREISGDEFDPHAKHTYPDIIYAYTRKDAIADGMLVDLSGPAFIMGFKIPVAITATALASCDDNTGDPYGLAFIMDHILRTMKTAIAKQTEPADRVSMAVKSRGQIICLYAVVGPGDTAAPVITIMLKGED